mmetsp:Transcript_20097/g.30296  ORF Transcript_20097/g.30296 Transcript_20097/m.30296 type:complete len:207 (+) Transcript_20097:40-660(+)|eukprot:scaffold123_cov101-Skeletonema_dohrnii-CCMP3373.AAC.2
MKTMAKATGMFAAYAAIVVTSASLVLLFPSNAFAFSPVVTKNISMHPNKMTSTSSRCRLPLQQSASRNDKMHISKLLAQEDDELQEEVTIESPTLLGISGLIASTIVLYSESVLFNTGCGLPAGPFGLVGAVEGISYLGVVGLIGFSLYTKVKTESGLPAGPGGILGAAEGVAYLAALAGILVLIAQVTNYGYIPNAVPMEGGMCK